jgi:hypothetical protein
MGYILVSANIKQTNNQKIKEGTQRKQPNKKVLDNFGQHLGSKILFKQIFTNN